MNNITYSTGSWLGIVRSGAVVVLEASTDPAIVNSLWDYLGEQTPSIHGALNAVTASFGTELTSLPQFAILVQTDRLHAILRGEISLVVTTAGHDEAMSGLDVTTWSERSLPLPDSWALALYQARVAGEEFSGATVGLPLRDGVAFLSALTCGTAPVADSLQTDTIPQAAGAPIVAPALPAVLPAVSADDAADVASDVEPEVAPDVAQTEVPGGEEPATEPGDDFEPTTADADYFDGTPFEDAASDVAAVDVAAFEAAAADLPVPPAGPFAFDVEYGNSLDTPLEMGAADEDVIPDDGLVPELDGDNPEFAGSVSDAEADLSPNADADLAVDADAVAADEDAVADDDNDEDAWMGFALAADAEWSAQLADPTDSQLAVDNLDANHGGADLDPTSFPDQGGSDLDNADLSDAELAAIEREDAADVDAGLTAVEREEADRFTPLSHLLDDAELPAADQAASSLDEIPVSLPREEIGVVPPQPLVPPVVGRYAEPSVTDDTNEPSDEGDGDGQPWQSASEEPIAVDSELPDSASTASLPESRPFTGAMVLARLCPQGHANPPSRALCADCGADIDAEPREVARPSLGRMHASTGEVLDLDHALIIGRQPSVSRVLGGVVPRLVQVQSASGDISRSHVEVRLDGWNVVLVDLMATNGTVLIRDGQEPRRLGHGEEAILQDGDIAELGDGVSLFFEGLL